MAELTGQVTFTEEEIATFPQGPKGDPGEQGPRGPKGDPGSGGSLSGWVSAGGEGVIGDGVTDDTGAFQQAVDKAMTDRKGVLVDTHSPRINGTVEVRPIGTQQPHFFRWWMPYAGFQNPSGNPGDKSVPKIICGNPDGPCIVFRGTGGGLKGLRVDGLKVWAGVTRFGKPLVQFGDENSLSNFIVRDMFLDGRAVEGFLSDGALVHTAYVGSFRDCSMQGMAAGIGWRLRNHSALNTGNIGWYDCTVNFSNPASLGGGVGWLLKEYFAASGNLVNNLLFSNCKVVGATNASKSFNTFQALVVNGAHVAGVPTVTVQDATGVSSGQWLTFSTAQNSRVWCDMVLSVSGNVITLQSGALAGPLANGDGVIVGNWHTVAGNVTACESHVSHWENCNGLLASGVHGFDVVQPLVGNLVPRGFYLPRGSTRVNARGGIGAGVQSSSIFFHQANDSGNARNSVVDIGLADLGWSAPSKLIQRDGPNVIGHRETTTWATV